MSVEYYHHRCKRAQIVLTFSSSSRAPGATTRSAYQHRSHPSFTMRQRVCHSGVKLACVEVNVLAGPRTIRQREKHRCKRAQIVLMFSSSSRAPGATTRSAYQHRSHPSFTMRQRVCHSGVKLACVEVNVLAGPRTIRQREKHRCKRAQIVLTFSSSSRAPGATTRSAYQHRSHPSFTMRQRVSTPV